MTLINENLSLIESFYDNKIVRNIAISVNFLLMGDVIFACDYIQFIKHNVRLNFHYLLVFCISKNEGIFFFISGHCFLCDA